jgi:cob(I)alamin adenosyltransferase
MLELKSEARDMASVWEKLYQELKTVPFTFVFMICVGIAVYALWTDHVSKADFNKLGEQVEELSARINGVKCTLETDHADSELHKTEAEIFQLDQKVKELKSKNQPIDEIYANRIEEVTHRQTSLIRTIQQLSQSCVSSFSR